MNDISYPNGRFPDPDKRRGEFSNNMCSLNSLSEKGPVYFSLPSIVCPGSGGGRQANLSDKNHKSLRNQCLRELFLLSRRPGARRPVAKALIT